MKDGSTAAAAATGAPDGVSVGAGDSSSSGHDVGEIVSMTKVPIDGAALGAGVGIVDGDMLGAGVGIVDGDMLGAGVGIVDGAALGASEEVRYGAAVGAIHWMNGGVAVGLGLGISEGFCRDIVGATVGALDGAPLDGEDVGADDGGTLGVVEGVALGLEDGTGDEVTREEKGLNVGPILVKG